MIKRFQKAGWVVIRQRGSHVRLELGAHRESVPLHKELKKGTEAKLMKRLWETR